MDKFSFPHVVNSIEKFMYDEEGNIPRSKVLSIGAMIIVLGILMADEAFAKHRSHSSHKSHSSHSSHSSGSSSGHSSHVSHSSHESHSSSTGGSHSSGGSSGIVSNTTPHSNHSNHVTHSNVAPKKSVVTAIKAPIEGDTSFLDTVNQTGMLLKPSEPPATPDINVP